MVSRRSWPALPAVVALVLSLAALPAAAAAFTGRAELIGTSRLQAGLPGVEGLQWPEFSPADAGGGDAPAFAPGNGPSATGALKAAGIIHRRLVGHEHGRDGPWGVESSQARPAGELRVSFDGLNHRDQRLANGGNQFSTEPPDQGLCVGNGFLLEVVNTALRVRDTAGHPLSGVADLNTFFGYPAALNRSAPPGTARFGPNVFDPSCYFDPDLRRWFVVSAVLEVDPVSGDLLGPNHVDIAVSQSDSPLGQWFHYAIATQNDGTQGTPDHGCGVGMPGNDRPHGPCFADYPHIGADAHGFYVTANEFELFGVYFIDANIYAFPKRALAAGLPATFALLGTNALAPGFTVWPAVTPPDRSGRCAWEDDDGQGHHGGTEYFLSSDAVFNDSGQSSQIWLWKLRNTASLDRSSPSLFLSAAAVPTIGYAVPPPADQKPGSFPLGQCIDDTTAATPFGPGCWQFLFVDEPPHDAVEGPLDTNDSRMQQVTYAHGLVWGALDTAVKVRGQLKAGVAWFAVDPGRDRARNQGYLALPGNHLGYPAIGVTSEGRGAIAFTVSGADYYPSAGYAPVDENRGARRVIIAAPGLGPQDGFSEYQAFVPPDQFRPRWGDYGAAAVDGDVVWIASEYIGQACTLEQYMTAPFGSCGGTRTSLANWGTRISAVRP